MFRCIKQRDSQLSKRVPKPRSSSAPSQLWQISRLYSGIPKRELPPGGESLARTVDRIVPYWRRCHLDEWERGVGGCLGGERSATVQVWTSVVFLFFNIFCGGDFGDFGGVLWYNDKKSKWKRYFCGSKCLGTVLVFDDCYPKPQGSPCWKAFHRLFTRVHSGGWHDRRSWR